MFACENQAVCSTGGLSVHYPPGSQFLPSFYRVMNVLCSKLCPIQSNGRRRRMINQLMNMLVADEEVKQHGWLIYPPVFQFLPSSYRVMKIRRLKLHRIQ